MAPGRAESDFGLQGSIDTKAETDRFNLQCGTTFYTNFHSFNQNNYELPFGDIFVLTLRTSLVIT